MEQAKTCPLCEEGQLHEKNEFYTCNFARVLTVYSVCDVCGAEQVDYQQSKLNKQRMLDVSKQVGYDGNIFTITEQEEK